MPTLILPCLAMASTCCWQRYPGSAEGRLLSRLDVPQHEASDGVVEDVVPVEPGAQMQEDAAEADRRTVHEHELARHLHRPFLLQRLVHGEGFPAPVLAGRGAIGDLALAVVEQGAVDEAGPDIQRVDQLVGKS